MSNLFEPFTLKGVTFKNRILRAPMGGKLSYYDGTVSPAWQRFELRLADAGVAALISATVSVDPERYAPLNFPKIAEDRAIAPLRAGIRAVQARDCRYIMQIGDGGYHAQMSAVPKAADAKTASPVIDLMFGYSNHTVAMTQEEIARAIANFASGARRAREAGCDGIEIAAHKGYLIHQFLNPGINRRSDDYGGTREKRFQLLREVMLAVRKAVGHDFLVGVRLAATDHNYLPLNLRRTYPFPGWPHRGNTVDDTLAYARDLAALGADYIGLTAGFGFPHPKESIGRYPLDEYRIYANHTRHLSFKAGLRAGLINLLPRPIAEAVLGLGWRDQPNAAMLHGKAFRAATGLPLIGNGGYQRRDQMEAALADGTCDLIAIARPLLANPDLLATLRSGRNEPERPCTLCNRCTLATATLPVGCYDRSRFDSDAEMMEQILSWSGGAPEALDGGASNEDTGSAQSQQPRAALAQG